MTDPPMTDPPMTDPQSPAELAVAIDAARQRLIGFAGACSADDWRSAPLDGDPRPVGVVVDHVAHSYEYLGGWMREIVAGRLVTVGPDIVDAYNAAHAEAAGQVSQAEAVGHLHRSGDELIEFVAGLAPADLDAGDGRTRRLAQIAIRHADDHRAEIEAALAAAG
jgi:DinB superfamily